MLSGALSSRYHYARAHYVEAEMRVKELYRTFGVKGVNHQLILGSLAKSLGHKDLETMCSFHVCVLKICRALVLGGKIG